MNIQTTDLLSGLLLGVLALPVVSAIIVALLGKASRSSAVYLSGLHLLATLALAVLGSGAVPEPGVEPSSNLTFHPIGVPGDVGDPTADEGVFSYGTKWALVSFGPNRPAIQLFFGIDGITTTLLVLTSLITFIAVLVSWDHITDRRGGYFAWLFLLSAATSAAFSAFDVLLFYICFELTLIPAFFLIGSWGTGGGRRDAARRFVLYTLFGSLFTLVGILGVVAQNPIPVSATTGLPRYFDPAHQTLSPNEPDGKYLMPKAGPTTFSLPVLMKNVQQWDASHLEAVSQARKRLRNATAEQRPVRERELAEVEAVHASRRSVGFWLFLALMAGFAVKIPIVPFHTWLPSAYAEAPLPITLFFSAVLAKLGTYGLIRIVIPLVPEAAAVHGLAWFGTLGAVGVVYAALCAYAQRDLKLLAAYSSVSHLGFLVVGTFALTAESLAGAVLHMVNHGLTAGALFALLAVLHRRYRTLDANQYGGLWSKYPVFTFFMMIITLAAVGLPGLNNFVSEMLMLSGLFDSRVLKQGGFALAAVGAFGVLLSSWYMFTLLRRVFFGPTIEPPTPTDGPPLTDLTSREFIPAAILSGLCVALGLFPQALLHVIQHDTDRVSNMASMARHRLDPNDIPKVRMSAEPAPPPRPLVGPNFGNLRDPAEPMAPAPRPTPKAGN